MVRDGMGNDQASLDRAYLRAAVLRLGGLLGWRAQEVIDFTEALTGRGWRHCTADDFQIVLDEYLALGQVIVDKAAPRAGDGRGTSEDGSRDEATR
jgi:hypothetical protein